MILVMGSEKRSQRTKALLTACGTIPSRASVLLATFSSRLLVNHIAHVRDTGTISQLHPSQTYGKTQLPPGSAIRRFTSFRRTKRSSNGVSLWPLIQEILCSIQRVDRGLQRS